MTALSTNAPAAAPKSGLFTAIANGVAIFFAAIRATAAIRAQRQPASADMKTLGIDPAHRFNF